MNNKIRHILGFPVIEAVVFEDSDLRELLTALSTWASMCDDIAGYTFNPQLLDQLDRGQVFVDRLCEEVWGIQKDKWRYGNPMREHVEFKTELKLHDVSRFLLGFEYLTLHELLHHSPDWQGDVFVDENVVHAAASTLLKVAHSD
jgi:hypothetical protein